eukprot:TRINITY_DN14999_c0_g1_i5.p2 TRINITY_DN14999_c0_g1~~TRINITY_DN14999_c0_g1_i5.p2  ORF type:complete len:136 (+),score=29.90 TRINITY_DN14999_c0_g1_i5:203-610(+)
MSFPDDFPNMPPVLQFKTDFFHPNIYPDGTVCISILHPPGKDEFNEMEDETERWRPVLGIEEILVSVISLIIEPNINSPANVDAAVMFRDNLAMYKKKVKELVRRSMDCLLYTSDAADEEDSVDLGGRQIIKKKK